MRGPRGRRAAVSRTGAARRLRGRGDGQGRLRTDGGERSSLDRWRLVVPRGAEAIGTTSVTTERPAIVLRCWKVPVQRMHDIWQMVYLYLVDGLLYYHNTRVGPRCIGTAVDYVRGGWQHSWDPRQDGYYHVPGATMIVHSDDRRAPVVYHEPPPGTDLPSAAAARVAPTCRYPADCDSGLLAQVKIQTRRTPHHGSSPSAPIDR